MPHGEGIGSRNTGRGTRSTGNRPGKSGFSFPARPTNIRRQNQTRKEFIGSRTPSSRPIRPVAGTGQITAPPSGGSRRVTSTPSGSPSGGTGGTGSTPVDRSQEETSLEKLRSERLAAAISAIGAQFASQEGALNSQIGDIKNLFNRGISDSLRTEESTIRNQEASAASRGLGRSGIFAQDLARALAPIAESRADLIGRTGFEEGLRNFQDQLGIEDVSGIETGTSIRDVESQIGLLGQQRASAEAEAQLQAEQDQLDIAELLALITAGLK